MNKVYIFLIVVIITGCKLSSPLKGYGELEDRKIRYDLIYNNRKQTHVPVMIMASTMGTKTHKIHYAYVFYLASDKVLLNKNREHFELHYSSDTANSKTMENGDYFIPITNFDRAVFNEVIYLSDSLRLKNFDFLKHAEKFKKIK